MRGQQGCALQPIPFFLAATSALGRAAANSRETFVPEDSTSVGSEPNAAQVGVCHLQSQLLPFPLLHVFVVGVAEHGEQQQQWDQQVGQVDGEQHQALAQRLRARLLRLGEVVEQDVGQDGKQSGGYVGGVDNGRSSDPSAATCIEAKMKQY